MASNKYTDRNGYLHIEGTKISRVQVAQYLGRQIDPKNKLGLHPPLEQNELYGVLRSADELFDREAMKSFEGMDFHVGHQMLGIGDTADGKSVKKPDNEPVDGVILNIRQSETEPAFLLADLIIKTERALRTIADGTKELSLGYRCYYIPVDSYPKPKYFEGEPYLFIQHNIRGNHLALVRRGRAGSDVRVEDQSPLSENGDSVMVCDSLPEEIITMEKNEENAKAALIALLNGTDEDIQNCIDYCFLTDKQKNYIKGLKDDSGVEEETEAVEIETPSEDGTTPPPPPKTEVEGQEDTEGTSPAGENPEESAPAPAPEPAAAPAEENPEESAPAPAPAPEPAAAPAEETGKGDEGKKEKPASEVQDEKSHKCGGECDCGNGGKKLFTQDELDAACAKAAEDALKKGRKEGCKGKQLAEALGIEVEDGASEAEVARSACKKIPELLFAQDSADDVAIACCRTYLSSKAKAQKDEREARRNAKARPTLLSVAQDEAVTASAQKSLNSGRFIKHLASH